MLLKVYDHTSKVCFKREEKVLKKIKELDNHKFGFPKMISSISNGKQSEILMELLGSNLKQH